jgi:hypothetical protein
LVVVNSIGLLIRPAAYHYGGAMRPRRPSSWVGLLAGALFLAGGAAVAHRLLAAPSGVVIPVPDPLASMRVQHVVAQLLLRQGGLSASQAPLVARADDLSTFLARHLAARRVPLRPLAVRVEDGWIEIAGTTSPRQLLDARSARVPGLPAALLDAEVWVTVRGRVRLDGRRVDLAPEQVWVGRQPVPAGWVWWLLGVQPDQTLTWRAPPIVRAIELQPGQIVLHTAAGGPTTGPGRS